MCTSHLLGIVPNFAPNVRKLNSSFDMKTLLILILLNSAALSMACPTVNWISFFENLVATAEEIDANTIRRDQLLQLLEAKIEATKDRQADMEKEALNVM